MGLFSRTGHTKVDSRPLTHVPNGKQSAAEKTGKHKSRKVSVASPFKKFINLVSSSPKSSKSIQSRSASVPDDQAVQKATVKRSESFPEASKSTQCATQTLQPEAFSAPNSVRGSDDRIDLGEAKNMFTEVVTNVLAGDLASESLERYAGSLDINRQGQTREQLFKTRNETLEILHEEMKAKVNNVIGLYMGEYPDLNSQFTNEEIETISRDLEAAVFNQMAKQVWSDRKVAESAERVAPGFEWLARRAKSPEKRPSSPRAFRPATPNKPIALKSRTISQATVEKTVGTEASTGGIAKAQTTPSAERSVSAVPPQTSSSTTVPSQPVQSSENAETVADVTGLESQENIAVQLGQGLKFLHTEIDTKLSPEAAGTARRLYNVVIDAGVDNAEAQRIVLLFKEAITDHGLTVEQAKSVGVEVTNWLNDDADFNSEEVFKAGTSFSQWLAQGFSEEEAHNALTQWLSDGVNAQSSGGDTEVSTEKGAEKTAEVDEARSQLLEEIRKGKDLKKVEINKDPPSVDARDALMADIRKGKKLNPAKRGKAGESKVEEGKKQSSKELTDVLSRGFEAKSAQIAEQTGEAVFLEDLTSTIDGFFFDKEIIDKVPADALPELKTELRSVIDKVQVSLSLPLHTISDNDLQNLIDGTLKKHRDGETFQDVVQNWVRQQTYSGNQPFPEDE